VIKVISVVQGGWLEWVMTVSGDTICHTVAKLLSHCLNRYGGIFNYIVEIADNLCLFAERNE